MRLNHHEQGSMVLSLVITTSPWLLVAGQAAIGAVKAKRRKGRKQ